MAIYFTKRGRVESWTTGNKSKLEVRIEPGATVCKPNALTTGPRHLPKLWDMKKLEVGFGLK